MGNWSKGCIIKWHRLSKALHHYCYDFFFSSLAEDINKKISRITWSREIRWEKENKCKRANVSEMQSSAKLCQFPIWREKRTRSSYSWVYLKLSLRELPVDMHREYSVCLILHHSFAVSAISPQSTIGTHLSLMLFPPRCLFASNFRWLHTLKLEECIPSPTVPSWNHI